MPRFWLWLGMFVLHLKHPEMSPVGICLRSIPMVLNLCYSGAFELQLPETLASRSDGEGFWELQSKNIWVTKVKNQWYVAYCNTLYVQLSLKSVWKFHLAHNVAGRLLMSWLQVPYDPPLIKNSTGAQSTSRPRFKMQVMTCITCVPYNSRPRYSIWIFPGFKLYRSLKH